MAADTGIPPRPGQTELSAETLGRLREGYGAFARGDIDGLLAHLHPDVEMHNPEYAVEPGVRHGRAALRKVLEGLLDLFDYQSIELEEIVPAGERVIVVIRVRGKARGSAVPIDETFAHLWSLRDGLGVRVQWFRAVEEARQAASADS